MKKIACILVVSLFILSNAGAVDRVWTNGSGDRDFARGSNWFDVADGYVFTGSDRPIVSLSGSSSPILNSNVTCQSLFLGYNTATTGEILITGGTNAFVSCVFAYVANSNGYMTVSGGNTNFTGFFTVGYTGNGLLTMTDGVLTVNRSQICQNVGSVGQCVISGGEWNVVTYLTVGSNGTGTIDMTGGALNVKGGILKLGDVSKASQGIINLSGTAALNVLTNSVIVGEDGVGVINMNGGSLICPSLSMGYMDDPNSQGYIYVADGTISSSGYFTIGTKSSAAVEISGGVVNANRMTVGQGLVGQVYSTNGSLTLSGGELNLENYLEIGRDGNAVFVLEGNAASLKLSRVEFGTLSTSKFVLNGQSGVGGGIGAFAGTQMDGTEEVVNEGDALFKAGALLDADFVTGTSVAGDYVVIASAKPASYLAEGITDELLAVLMPAGDMTDMLTPTAQGAGWKATLYDAGSGSAVVLTSPVTAAKAAWASAGDSNVAVVDGATVNMSSAKTANGATIGDTGTGTLNIAAGANGAFVNFTVGADAGSNGTVAMSGGTVNVASAAYIGKNGAASMDISGGSFSALNVIAASGENATADIAVSGDASFDAGNMLALTDGANFTLSGYQTTTGAGNLTLDADATITFALDAVNGVGNGILVDGNVVLDGTINIESIGERTEGTFAIIRAAGKIFNNRKDLVNTSFVNYDIVQDGDYQVLQVTLFSPENCGEVVSGGFALAADMNEDCYVNIEDISILATQWLTCNNPQDAACNWLGN